MTFKNVFGIACLAFIAATRAAHAAERHNLILLVPESTYHFVNDSPLPPHRWPGMDRNVGPA